MNNHIELVSEEQNIYLDKSCNEIDDINENDEANRLNYEIDRLVRENQSIKKDLENLCSQMIKHMYGEQNMFFREWVQHFQKKIDSNKIRNMLYERKHW